MSGKTLCNCLSEWKIFFFLVFPGEKTLKQLCLNLCFLLGPLGCNNPPPLTDGDTTESLRFHYSHDERVEYICQNLYQMEGEPYLTCVNGKWVGKMRCLSKLQIPLNVSCCVLWGLCLKHVPPVSASCSLVNIKSSFKKFDSSPVHQYECEVFSFNSTLYFNSTLKGSTVLFT